MSNSNNNTAANTVTFLMGLPAAGKSTWVNANLAATHNVIDPDAVKESHPDYDPKNPAPLHAWSKEVTEAMWVEALAQQSGKHAIDGTGTNAESMVRKINQARRAGYSIELVFVKVSLATSLERNAKRERNVPEHIIRSKALDVQTAFEIVAPYADSVIEVVNE